MNSFHTPALLKEVISGLGVERNKKYIDATVGGGGHSFEILKLGGIVLGIDCDKDAIDYVEENWKLESEKYGIPEKNLTLVKGKDYWIDYAEGRVFFSKPLTPQDSFIVNYSSPLLSLKKRSLN